MSPEIFGTPLPDSVFEWVALLVAIWAALLTTLAVAEKFSDALLGRETTTLRRCGGLALPLGWVAWCVALLVAHHGPISVLIVLIGTASLLIVSERLIRRCKPGSK